MNQAILFDLHVGTNNLADHSPNQIVEEMKLLVDMIISQGTGCTVPAIIARNDGLGDQVQEVNNLLKRSLPRSVTFLEHSNINESHLNGSGLHLNRMEPWP